MSAIQRDREIAVKATQGVWRKDAMGRSITDRFAIKAKWSVDMGRVPTVTPLIRAADAEHIVRFHNRQPLYDALVDAVCELDRALIAVDVAHADREMNEKDHFDNIRSCYERIMAATESQRRALAALDREDAAPLPAPSEVKE